MQRDCCIFHGSPKIKFNYHHHHHHHHNIIIGQGGYIVSDVVGWPCCGQIPLIGITSGILSFPFLSFNSIEMNKVDKRSKLYYVMLNIRSYDPMILSLIIGSWKNHCSLIHASIIAFRLVSYLSLILRMTL